MSVSKAVGKSETMEPERPWDLLYWLFWLRMIVADFIRTLSLLGVSILFLPISYAIAIILTAVPPSFLAYILPFSRSTLTGALCHRTQCRAKPTFRQRTVLVTGVGMTKGLTLARAFWLCGHRVVAADFDIDACAAWTPWKKGQWTHSLAFDKVYPLRRPVVEDYMNESKKEEVRREYISDISKIVKDEDVDLWVSCSGVASAVEDAMVKEALDQMPLQDGRSCACIQFDVPTTSILHEKSTFIQYGQRLKLAVPETFDVTSHAEVLDVLASETKKNPHRKFILKPVGIDDAYRANMTLFPLSNQRETEMLLSRRDMSRKKPWIVQQFIPGGREYCTHALVVAGAVRVFAACPSSELLMHYEALPPGDPLAAEMLRFTTRFAAASGPGFTGHLSFDFMVEEDNDGHGRLFAIECNPRAHTAVALFAQHGERMRGMVEAYMSAVNGSLEPLKETYDIPSEVVRTPADVTPRYWIGHDLFTRGLLPLLDFILRETDSGRLLADRTAELKQHLLYWKDGTFEMWDPWPFVALYHHYWPRTIFNAWMKQERWGRLNVSTTKMFRF